MRSRFWYRTTRADDETRKIADRHYNRQKVGSPQFVPPGRCLVLRTASADAFWVTSYPYAEFVNHAWAGAWVCSAFRNESAALSSEMIVEAVALPRAEWETPDLGMVTFVNTDKTRRKRDPGRCYRKAGFVEVGQTVGGLVALQMFPAMMAYLPDMEPMGGTCTRTSCQRLGERVSFSGVPHDYVYSCQAHRPQYQERLFDARRVKLAVAK